jgi:two-component system chemotaxis response regulator CheB
MIRVLVADDSRTARQLLVEILRRDPEIEVVGEARDGLEAVHLAQQLKPQLITMDIHMPQMDGLTATKEIMITAPTPIVIVTGSTQPHEVEVALHVLRAGALTVLARPPGPESPVFESAAQQFVATLKAMAQVKVVRHWRSLSRPVPPRPAKSSNRRTALVAIAASTGGPAALQRLLSQLPGDFPASILVVQHITPGFMPGLVTWLNASCDLQVKLAECGERLAPHQVYFAPDGYHLGVSPRDGTVTLSSTPSIGGFRPSATFLFESVARACGSSAIAVVLTGMGQDGVEGLRAVRQAGARIIAQDEETSVVFGMPGTAVAAGLPDLVLPLDAIAPWLEEAVERGTF